MNYRNVTNEFLSVARLYQQDMGTAVRYIEENELKERLHQNGIAVETRDFIPMYTLMGIKGETREERDTDICLKIEELATAYSDPEESKRDDFLDLIFYLVDDYAVNFDPAAMNMTDPAQVERLLQSMMIEQTVRVTKLENPEYINKRYPTPEDKNLMEACDRYRSAVSTAVATNLFKNDIEIGIQSGLPKAIPDELMEIQYLREEHARSLLNTAVQTKGMLPKSQTVDFPIPDSMVPLIGGEVEFNDEQVKNYFNLIIESTLMKKGTQGMQGMQQAGIEDVMQAVYIDGQPFADFVKEHFPDGAPSREAEVIAGICILRGENKVDVVNAYRNEAGEMQYEAKTVRISVTPEQEARYLQQFSWLRRTFNRGSFRIESLQEKLDRIAEDPKAEERLAGVIADHKMKIEKGLAKVREDALKRQRNVQKREQHKADYQKAKDRLEASVSKWDKDSVIGVLGQQITATYVMGGSEMPGACDAIREAISTSAANGYERMAPLFARVVLYSQLCSEREANGGAPGDLEMLLGTGNTVRENIDNTIQKLAKDPAFQNLVLKKMGNEDTPNRCPDRVKFEKMIISGGCGGFWLEYKQNLKYIGSQNDQPAAIGEVQMEIGKQQKAKKIMM